MERLTYMDGGKWKMKVFDTVHSGKEVDRIAAYEEAGVEPEDILNSTDMAKVACALYELNKYKELGDLARLQELTQADKEGRCAILSEPMRPMVQHHGGTDVYCPACGETLSGGWPLSDADDTRRMYQCPNCGQSIDTERCVVKEELS